MGPPPQEQYIFTFIIKNILYICVMKCYSPQEIKLKTPIYSHWDGKFINTVPVGCGKCSACISRRIAEWSFRLENERINSDVTYFVTLTYDNYHVPINGYGKMTLYKKDLQKFFKRLRYDQKADPNYGIFENHYFKTDLRNRKISYYAVGEYGSTRKRPHYHLILFNASKTSIIDNWNKGEVDIQIPRDRSCMSYVIKYLSKRLFHITPKNVDREFSLMSKGIGKGYIDKMKSFHKANPDILYTSDVLSTKIPMSKYYRNNIFTDEEKLAQIPIIKNNIEEHEKEEREIFGENYEAKISHRQRQFSNKFKSKNRPRADI